MAIEAGPVALGGNASRPGIGLVKWPCWRYPSVKYGTWNSTKTGSVTGKILWWSMFYCHVWHQRVHIIHVKSSPAIFLIFLTCSVFLPFTNFHDGWQLRCTASFWQSGLGGMADVITFNAALSRALGKLRPETTGVTRVRRVVSSHGNHLPLKIVIQNHWRWSSKDDPHQVAPEELGFYGISWDFQIFIPPPTAESLLLDAIFSEHPSPSGACVNRSDFAFQIFQVTDLRNPQDSLSFQAFTSCSIKFEDQNISKWSNMNPSMSIYVHLCPSMSIYVHLCPSMSYVSRNCHLGNLSWIQKSSPCAASLRRWRCGNWIRCLNGFPRNSSLDR